MSSGVTVVLRALGLGDFVTGLPALALLREARPDDEIVLAAPRVFAPVLPFVPSVDRLVHAHELDPIRDLPSRPDLAVDLHGNGPASRDLLVPARPRQLLAFCDGPVHWRADEHEVARWQRLLVEGLGLPDAPYRTVAGALGSPPPADVPTGVTVVHCGAASASRRWPAVRLATTALLLAAEGHRVVVTGGPAERELAERIGLAADVEVRDDLSLPELFALIGRARLLVSGDTGVAHVAAAYRTPSVTLFGPVSPERWGPPADERHQVLWHGDGGQYRGDPHGTALDPALERITVEEVLDACRRADRVNPARSAA